VNFARNVALAEAPAPGPGVRSTRRRQSPDPRPTVGGAGRQAAWLRGGSPRSHEGPPRDQWGRRADATTRRACPAGCRVGA